MVETLLFDGPDKPFCVGIEIRTSRWQLHWIYASSLQNAFELRCVQRISVMDQVSLACQEAVFPG